MYIKNSVLEEHRKENEKTTTEKKKMLGKHIFDKD